jgi:hypothetical protein
MNHNILMNTERKIFTLTEVQTSLNYGVFFCHFLRILKHRYAMFSVNVRFISHVMAQEKAGTQVAEPPSAAMG